MRPNVFRHLLNVWPPYRGAGISVRRIKDDYTEIDVELRLGLLNKNYFGTHFGGSLYAMTDPFFALMMVNQIGKGFNVWDKAASIDFIKPGRGVVKASFVLAAEEVERVRQLAKNGDKILPEYEVDVVDTDGDVVAKVHKTLYVRKRR